MDNRASGLRVVGLKEVRVALGALGEREFTDALKDVHYRVADLVVGRARQKAASRGRISGGANRRTARQSRYGGLPAPVVAASTLRPSRRASGAAVLLGNEKVPFALGQEFGAHPDKRRPARRDHTFVRNGVTYKRQGAPYVGYRQFPRPMKHNSSTGFMYPALADAREEITTLYLKAVDDIVNRAFRK